MTTAQPLQRTAAAGLPTNPVADVTADGMDRAPLARRRRQLFARQIF